MQKGTASGGSSRRNHVVDRHLPIPIGTEAADILLRLIPLPRAYAVLGFVPLLYLCDRLGLDVAFELEHMIEDVDVVVVEDAAYVRFSDVAVWLLFVE
jgi:hypothetical protein